MLGKQPSQEFHKGSVHAPPTMPYSLSFEALFATTLFHWLEQVWKRDKGSHPKICAERMTDVMESGRMGPESAPHLVCRALACRGNKISRHGLEV